MATNIKKPLVGPGRFQWNAGGWYGSSLGSSAWMVITSCFLVFHNQPLIALVPAVGLAVTLLVSILLWTRRDRVYPFTSLMMLFGFFAIAIPAVWFFVQLYGSTEVLAAMNWPVSTWTNLFVVSIVPAVMIWFLVLERIGINRDATLNRSTKTVA
jgi:hypothetical protein